MENIVGIAIVAIFAAALVWFLFLRPSKARQTNIESKRGVVPPVPESGVNADGLQPQRQRGLPGDLSEAPFQVDHQPDDDQQPRTAAELEAQGDENLRQGDFESAIEAYDEALELARKEHGRNSLEVAGLLVKRGEAYQRRDEDDDSDETDPADYPRVLAILSQKHGPDSPLVLPVLARLIGFYDQTGRHGAADTLAYRYSRIVSAHAANTTAATDDQATSQFDAMSAAAPEVAEPVTDSELRELLSDAEKHAAAFDYDDAIESFESALEKARELYGHGSEAAASILVPLGLAYQNRDDEDDESDPDPAHFFRLALCYLESIHGPTAKCLAEPLRHLAAAYDEQCRHSEADAMVRRLDALVK